MEQSFYYIQKQKMYDILDGNFQNHLDNSSFSQLSTFPNRPGSMKKVNKKENIPNQPKLANLSSFDQLINGFLDKSSAKPLQNSENLSRSTSKRQKLDIFDVEFSNQANPKTSTPLNISSPSSSVRSPSYTEQQHKLNTHFGHTQKTIINPSRIQESSLIVSSRNMKPPIRKRENYSYITNNIFNSQIGATIPEQDPNLTNSSGKVDSEYPYPQIKNRRSSIDARSQINIDQSFTSKGNNKHELYSSKGHDKVKEESLENLANTQSHIIDWKHYKSVKIENSHKGVEKNPIITVPQKKTSQNSHINEQQILQRIQKSNKLLIEDYQRQINLIKESHQRHSAFLQQELNKQITQNKEMRQNFMKQSAKILDEQRGRTKHIHQEQISRLKDMFQWEKKRLIQTYKCQIQSLKNMANYQQKMDCKSISPSFDRYQLENTENKLKLWENSLHEKEILLERRQSQLSQRVIQINTQKRHDDQRFRSQQKRLMQMQMGLKRQIMSQKQQISQEKHQISAEMGQLQLQILKERQRNQLFAQENQIERQAIQKQKTDLRKISNEVMHSHQNNLQQIQQERERLSQLELQLVKKIRTVQMKAKELYIQRNNEEENCCFTHEKTIKIRQNDRSSNSIRRISKDMNSKSMASLMKTKETKERFYQMQSNHRNNLNTSIKQNKKLDLSRYISKIQHFSKNRQ